MGLSPGPHPYLVTQVPTWESPGPGESGPYLVSLSPGGFIPHLDLIAVDSLLVSPGTGDSDPNWASPRSGDSGPHLGIIDTWLVCSTPEPHRDMMTLEPLWDSPGAGTLVLNWAQLHLVNLLLT